MRCGRRAPYSLDVTRREPWHGMGTRAARAFGPPRASRTGRQKRRRAGGPTPHEGKKLTMSADPQSVSPSAVIARQDRIQVWSLPYLFVFIIGIGFLFTFYDIFDINVSFLQTCSQIVSHCVAAPLPGHGVPNGFVEGSDRLGLPVLWNLIGYVIGALILSPLS